MDANKLHRISKALADPHRLEILERIADADEVACATLVSKFPVSQATISHHLKELHEAGLIDVRRQGKFGYMRLRKRVWQQYLAQLAKLR